MSRTFRKNQDKDQKAARPWKKCSTWARQVRREGKK